MRILLNIKKNSYIFFLFLFAIFIGVLWFFDQKQIAGGEESFAIFNLRPIMPLNGYWEDIGTGFANPSNLGRIPLSLAVHFLSFLGIKMWLIQAFFFIFTVSFGLISFFLLIRELLDKEIKNGNAFFLLGGIFYFSNLYSLSQVWARFLYAHMAVWALLPFFLLFWIRFIKTGTIKNALLFLFGSFLFSLAFMQVAFLFTIWTPIGIWTILYFLQTRKKEKIKAIKRAFILFIAWCATNIWWLYPMYILSKYAFSDRLTGQSSIDTLRGVSQYFPSEQIFILKQSFGFGELSPWFGFYSNNFILSLSVIIFALVLMGIGFYKSKSSFLLVILLFVGWFVSKGSNPPFGNEFFTFLFEKIPFLGVLRNSYEKFGLVFVVPYTIYFVLAIHYLTFGLKNLHRKILLGAIFIGILVLNYPLISGQVFSMNKVRVPQDYDVVNDFIKKEKKDSRILIMPMLPGDGIDYSWGYVGVEASEYFFDNPSISKMLRQPYFDDKYMIMIDRYVRNENIYEEMNELGIGYVLLNEDVLGERRNASTSAEVKKYLSQFEKIKLINKEGAISLYEYNGNKNTDLIVTQGDGAPNIAYKKINSGEYEVSVMGAKEPFDLILKNSFSPLWKAQIDEKIVANHSLIYNYANVWNIEKRGDFIVKVKFKVWPWD